MKLGTYIYVLSVPDIVVCLRFIFYFNHFVCMYAPFLISVHKCTIVWGAGVLLASMWLMYIHYMRQKEDGRNRKQACGQHELKFSHELRGWSRGNIGELKRNNRERSRLHKRREDAKKKTRVIGKHVAKEKDQRPHPGDLDWYLRTQKVLSLY